MLKPSLAALALASSLVACSRDHFIGVPTSTEVPKMTVTGSATLQVAPDCADLTLTVSADAPQPLDATTKVNHEEDAVVAALTQAGVAKTDLKLSMLALEPVYASNPATPWATATLNGYRASIVITATTRDFSKIALLMDTGAKAGASAMTSQLRRSDLSQLKQQVREMALVAATDKAKQTARVLGVDLGHIVSVAENPAGAMWNNAYFPSNMMVEQASSPGSAIGGVLQPLTLDVTIAYALPTTT